MTLAISSSAPVLPSMWDSRLAVAGVPQHLLQAIDLAQATASGEKSSMLSKVMSTAMLPFTGERVGHLEGDAGAFMDFMRASKLSTSISMNCGRPPAPAPRPPDRQVGQHAHDEGQLDLLLGAVGLDVVLDLCTRGARLRR